MRNCTLDDAQTFQKAYEYQGSLPNRWYIIESGTEYIEMQGKEEEGKP